MTQVKSNHNKEETQQLFSLFSKLLTGLISLSVTVSLCVAGFSLRETYSAQLSIRELQAKISAVEVSEVRREQAIHANTVASYKVQLVEQSIGVMQDDIKSIKSDLRILIQNNKERP